MRCGRLIWNADLARFNPLLSGEGPAGTDYDNDGYDGQGSGVSIPS